MDFEYFAIQFLNHWSLALDIFSGRLCHCLPRICINRNKFSILTQLDLLVPLGLCLWFLFEAGYAITCTALYIMNKKCYKFKAQAKICSFEGVTEFSPFLDNIYLKHKMCIIKAISWELFPNLPGSYSALLLYRQTAAPQILYKQSRSLHFLR